MFIEYNVNPADKKVGDCVIRALTKALGMTWEEVYLALCLQGYKMYDMPSSNAVWGAFLRSKGFKRGIISDSCPDCYTIEDFCKEYPQGIYIIGTGSHAVTAIDGNVYDSWDALDDMVEELEELMGKAPDEPTKKEFRRFINKVQAM